MRRLVLAVVPGVVIVLVIGLWSASANAGGNDLVLSRLGLAVEQGVIGNNRDFRALASELGVVLAPRLLSPSDTLGYGGFQFTTDLAFTGISNSAPFWRVLQSSAQPDGPGPHGNALMPTISVFARKGMWLPLPSFELGAGVVHMLSSRLLAAQGYAKFALHEGFHDMPLPSVAVRGAVSRMMGETDLDLTVASGDVSVSKEFAIKGSVNLAPYLGWNLLVIVPRSEVIDKTPQIADDRQMNFVFRQQDPIFRNRLFAGVQVKYHVFVALLEFNVALAGSSYDDQPGTSMSCADVVMPTTVCDTIDESGSQISTSMSIGVDF